jgi:hypothetical protein
LKLYGKSRAKYHEGIRNAVRMIWLISKGRKDAFKRTRVKNTDGSAKIYKECCEHCGKQYAIKEKEFRVKKNGELSKKRTSCLVAHHIELIPSVFDPMFLTYMFCEQCDNPSDGYLILCNDCHYKVHNP